MNVLLSDRSVADSAIGFHAQQAVEKALKSVLADRGVDFPWTHDLQLLLRRIEAAGVEIPECADRARRLTPWSVEYRYGEVIEDPLDRAAAAGTVDEVIAWAESSLS